MKYYTFLTNNIKELLENKLLTSNHLSNKWDLLLGQRTLVIFATNECIQEISPEEIDNKIPVGNYLVELTDEVLKYAVDEIPYSSYLSLTHDLDTHSINEVKVVYDRSKSVTKYSNLNAIFITELKKEFINAVYRCNPVPPYWVKCEIADGKLIHKIQ